MLDPELLEELLDELPHAAVVATARTATTTTIRRAFITQLPGLVAVDDGLRLLTPYWHFTITVCESPLLCGGSIMGR